MNKIDGLVAVSLASLALMACGSGAATGSDTGSEASAEQTGGTSDMMGGDNDEPNPNLGTANGQDLGDVDVKTTPNMKQSEEKMTGADVAADQKPEPQ